MGCNTSKTLSLVVLLLIIIPASANSFAGSDEIIYDRNISPSIEWLQEGRWLLKPGNNRDPIDAFSRSIELDPNNFRSYINRGNAYMMQKQYDLAIKDYTTAIELQPKAGEAYNNRGIAFGMKQQHERAIDDFAMAIILNKNDFKAYVNRGNSYRMKKQYNMAIKDYTRAIELKPRHATTYYNSACVYSLMNNTAEACKFLKKSIDNGFNTWSHIKSNDCFDNIRNSACYIEIMSNK